MAQNLLQKYLKDKGLTYAQFGRIMGCKPCTIYNWANNKHLPSPKHAWKIYKSTNGEIPITHWGLVMQRNKIKRISRTPLETHPVGAAG